MAVDLRRLARVLERCGEIAALPEGEGDKSVTRVYNDFVAAPAGAFIAAHKGMKDAEAKARKESGEGIRALANIDRPYAKVRSVIRHYVKDVAIPETLKSLDTDTDRMSAIRTAVSIIDERKATEEWAKELAEDTSADSFMILAPIAIREIKEWIAANSTVEQARRDRAAAYGVAYEAYLDFKDLVRNAFGSTSIHYRRIHVQSNGKIALDDVDDGTDAEA